MEETASISLLVECPDLDNAENKVTRLDMYYILKAKWRVAWNNRSDADPFVDLPMRHERTNGLIYYISIVSQMTLTMTLQ
jgi:hypothetical protein